jgi:hypothetical protein
MAHNNIEKLLGVNWYDGLLVNELHFSHADRRSNHLFAESQRLQMRQPGVIDVDTSVGTGMLPVEIIEVNHQEKTVGITFKLSRTIKALTPSGQLFIGVESSGKRLGWPVPHLKVVQKKESFPPGEYVVAARPEYRRGLKVDYQVGRFLQQEGVAASNEEIELAYPAVGLEIIEVSQYKSNIHNAYEDYISLGLLENAGTEIKLRKDFIPPVLRLEHARAFGGDIDDLSSKFHTLISNVSRKRDDLARSLVGELNAELLLKSMDLQVLWTFLLVKLGMIQNLPQISATTFFFDLIYPLSDWHERFFARAYGEDGLSKFYARRPDIKGLTWQELCINTEPLLSRSMEQLKQVIQDIDFI